MDHLDLLKSLAGANWKVAGRTFGNDHSTLIGLLVEWWIMMSPGHHSALEGGPSFGYRSRSVKGGGQCDAVFCSEESPVGILEVEGLRPIYTIEKVGKSFAAEHSEFQTLEFAIVLLYAYEPVGRGAARQIPPAGTQEAIEAVMRVSADFPGKAIVLITLDKVYERHSTGIRARNEYYWGRPSRLSAFLYEGGCEEGSRDLAYWDG